MNYVGAAFVARLAKFLSVGMEAKARNKMLGHSSTLTCIRDKSALYYHRINICTDETRLTDIFRQHSPCTAFIQNNGIIAQIHYLLAASE